MKLDHIAFAYADKLARHNAAESPKSVFDIVGEPPAFFDDIEIDDDFGRVSSGDGRRHFGRNG